MPRWTRLTLAACCLTLVSSCVYYNKFYNAKKQFEAAHEQRLESEADPDNRILANAYLDYYLSAIRKASTVLQLHPDSKWVDDSLLLIGKSYYWRGEHAEAILKFDELLDNFPESELRTEARYWKAISLWGNEEVSQSRDLLLRIGEGEDRHFAWQARLALAELERDQENHDIAIRTYLGLVDSIQDRELRTRLWKGLADTYFAQASYENALNAYLKVLKTKPDAVTSYQTRIQIGTIHELTGDLDAALDTYRRIERSKRFRLYQPKVQLKIANVYRLNGDIDGALDAYNEIIKQNPRTETSAEAYYQIALIEHQVRRNNEVALELFAQARKERTTSEAAVKAREMETTLFQLDRFKKRADGEGDRGIEALFNVAEIYLLSLGEVDSALSTYERILAREDSTATPKALYGMGVIQADSLGNETAADSLFKRLVDEYPVTPYAVDARRRIGRNRSDDVLAEARYIEAETLKAEGADPSDVITILRQVTDEYPSSLYAPKALFALAWAYENDVEDLEAAAEHYGQLASRYPLTQFAEVSEEKVKQIERDLRDLKREQARAEKEKEKAKEATKKKSADGKAASGEKKAASAPPAPGPDPGDRSSRKTTDSYEEESGDRKAADPAPAPPAKPDGPLDASQVEQLPSLVHAPPPPEAEELEEEDVSPNVTVRMLVGRTGRVVRVVVVDGADVLQEKVVDVAFQYRFEPGMHKGKPVEVWMEFPITFVPPDGGGEPQ